MRYVELNPLRAGMVVAPGDYRWSSYRVNALGGSDKLVIPHVEYLALGAVPEERRQNYRHLFVTEVDDPAWNLIRQATQQGVLVADSHFAEIIEQRLGCGVQPRPRGRPPKTPENKM